MSDTVTTGPICNGPIGRYGPNDDGYLARGVLDTAKKIKTMQELWSQGHYAHSNARLLPVDHALVLIQTQLKEYFVSICAYGNTCLEEHREIFEVYVPSQKDQTRWDGQQGVAGA